MDFLDNRRKSLEEAFFHEQEKKKLESLRNELDAKKTRDELGSASGITDDAALDQLVALGVTGQTVAALSLVPLLQVAWADGKMDESERTAVIQAAEAKGIDRNSPTGKLLYAWLDEPPPQSLYDAWHAYIQALTQSLVPAQRELLKKQIVGFARQVAEAAGGFLGLAKVSASEEKALAAIESAFE